MRTNRQWLWAVLSAALCALCLSLGLILASCNGGNTPGGTDTQDGTDTAEPAAVTDTEPAATEPVTEAETEPETDTEPETETDAPFLSCVSPAEGETVSLLNDMMTKWVSRYRKANLDRTWKIEERCEPVGTTLTWACGGDPLYYHVYVADNADFTNAETYLAVSPSVFLGRLFVGTTYYWRVDATLEDPSMPGEPGDTVSSAVWSFNTMMTPRTMAVDGVSNVRDIGGYTTADGKYRVKQGMVYRGAELDKITEAGMQEMLLRMGIATELDIRGANLSQSILGKSVKYFTVNAPYYNQVLYAEYRMAVKSELRVFADPSNYPIYFHCALGRDRTGTLAFMLGCILNLKDSDLYMDFETTFFSDFGGYIDNTPPSGVLSGLTSFAANIKKETGKPDLHSAMMSYLLEIGMTQEELDAIRANLLEELPGATEQEGN